MVHLGAPSTRPGKFPPLPACPPVDLLVKPKDLAVLANIQEPKKVRWREGIANLWHIIESTAPGSAVYQNAYVKLVRITNAVKEAYDKQSTAFPFKGPNDSAAPNGYNPEAMNPGLQVRATNASKAGESSASNAAGKLPQRMNIGAMNLATKEFVNLAEIPDRFMNCGLCENAFSIEELAGQGFTIYPVRLPGCGHIFCYDCARMYISHSKCPECDAKLGDPIQALAHIDEQIENCRRYLISSFNARLQSGLIRAPPGYPTLGPQKQKESTFMSNDDYDDDATISDNVSESAEYGAIVWKGKEREVGSVSNDASTMSGAVSGPAEYGAAAWRGINTIPLDDIEAAYTLLDMRYAYSTPSLYRN
ncbi:hypothetical protein OEA41_000344 [Lepraria neglecta]|uniref:RING-type domain-containing protein n=1 Tax=Lepraria neglecta TaxID=209136 RepID=A0AAE0DPD3_9LECA|nr:hypothetical protein OEA41_000344 [Lepraria neglecta]